MKTLRLSSTAPGRDVLLPGKLAMATILLEVDQGAYFTMPVLHETMKDRKIPRLHAIPSHAVAARRAFCGEPAAQHLPAAPLGDRRYLPRRSADSHAATSL